MLNIRIALSSEQVIISCYDQTHKSLNDVFRLCIKSYFELLEDGDAWTIIKVPYPYGFIVGARYDLPGVRHHDGEYVIGMPLDFSDHLCSLDIPNLDRPLILLILSGWEKHVVPPFSHSQSVDILPMIKSLNEGVLSIRRQTNQFNVTLPIPRGDNLCVYLAYGPNLALMHVACVSK